MQSINKYMQSISSQYGLLGLIQVCRRWQWGRGTAGQDRISHL